MRKAILIIFTVLLTVRPMAQPRLPPYAQAMDVTSAELQTMIKAYPGGNAEINSTLSHSNDKSRRKSLFP